MRILKAGLALVAAFGLPILFGVGAYSLSAGSLAAGETRVAQKAIGKPMPAAERGSNQPTGAAAAAQEPRRDGEGAGLNPSQPSGESTPSTDAAGSGGADVGEPDSSGPGPGEPEDSGSGSDDSGSDDSGSGGSDDSGSGSDDSGSDDSGSDGGGDD